MEQRLSLVTLGVSDLARAVTFYTALGWKPNNNVEAQGVAFFHMGFEQKVQLNAQPRLAVIAVEGPDLACLRPLNLRKSTRSQAGKGMESRS